MYVVTGGGQGIGRALAIALAERGQRVLIVGRHEHSLLTTVSVSPHIERISADVSTIAGRQSIVERLKNVPVIQGLIHNAGIIEPILPAMEMGDAAWRQCMATNLDAPLFLTQALRDKLQQGRVLTIGSGAAYFPVAGWTAYCVSKAALAMLVRCCQLETNDIAFASVMPGIIDTAMQAQIRLAEHMNAEKRDFFKTLKQENRLLTAATVALFLCWLLLDIEPAYFVSKEWDIYDESHHPAWLIAPHEVPPI
jgi:benzil reductase ((S)-benzoin forming)